VIKKSLALALIIVMVAWPSLAVAQDPLQTLLPLEAIDRLELELYGAITEGSSSAKLDRLEKELFGMSFSDPSIERIQRAIDYVFSGRIYSPSLQYRMKVLEWVWFQEISHGPLISRVERLEAELEKKHTGGILARIEGLITDTWPGARMTPELAQVPVGQLLKLRLTESVSTSTAQPGDVMEFVVVNDLYIGKHMVIPKGSIARATIIEVKQPWYFGKNGQLIFEFDYVECIDGTTIPIALSQSPEGDNSKMYMAIGASFVGLVVLRSPVGLLAGAFIKGQDVEITSSTYIYVETKAVREVQGIAYTR
jgi:hypothetical protein